MKGPHKLTDVERILLIQNNVDGRGKKDRMKNRMNVWDVMSRPSTCVMVVHQFSAHLVLDVCLRLGGGFRSHEMYCERNHILDVEL